MYKTIRLLLIVMILTTFILGGCSKTDKSAIKDDASKTKTSNEFTDKIQDSESTGAIKKDNTT